jgi:segregation and condensation protein B
MDPRKTSAKRLVEAALLCADLPVPVSDLRVVLGEGWSAVSVNELLEALRLDWVDRGLELVQVSGGWRFQTRPDVKAALDRLHPEKPPRYSRAVLETLAIIAYHQPVTRGDIEDIRGVTVATPVIRQLEDRGWVEVIGYRESPGRPGLYATTTRFLDELGLKSLSEMPPLEGLGEAPGSDLKQPELVPAMDAETLAPPTSAVIAAGS